jgi:hypothetical protein
MSGTCTLALAQDRASPHWILSDVLKEGQDVRWHLGEIPSVSEKHPSPKSTRHLAKVPRVPNRALHLVDSLLGGLGPSIDRAEQKSDRNMANRRRDFSRNKLVGNRISVSRSTGRHPAGFGRSAHQISYCFTASTRPRWTSHRHHPPNRAAANTLREWLRIRVSESRPSRPGG